MNLPHKTSNRIPALDGLRGLAIVLVVFFHGYARWPDYMAWTTTYRDFPVFKYGYLGVELFFLISGFVILMTLENCKGFAEFIYRRWLRLFPAMLIATILVYCTARIFYERPSGSPNIYDIFPGLLFVEPALLNDVFGIQSFSIEGAFWSLFVEVKFYFIFGVIYFLNRSKAILVLSVLFLVYVGYKGWSHFHPEFKSPVANYIYLLTSIQYFGWFAIGALVYDVYKQRGVKYLYASLFMLVPAITGSVGYTPEIVLSCVLVYAVFVSAILTERVSSLMSSRVLVFLGFISYPLYLIHENAMVSLTIKLHSAFPSFPNMLTPIPGLLALVLAAYLIAKYLEPRMKSLIESGFARVKSIRYQP